MSFREKTAWVTLAALLLVSLLYLLLLHRPGGWMLHTVAFCVLVFVAIEFVAWLVLRMRNPVDARTPKDELERLIELKARRIAAWVYVAGSFLAIFLCLHVAGAGSGTVGMSVLVAFVVAEIVNYAARIAYYRRNA